ncbi:MAG: hypothetical protein CRN43_01945 [Candidatus Nephrothrix sp. EaCA]|nr:MAG: hypothetical protein CRN43_01945 [Candidatus Nephrothrix sp. EaCA]
MAKKVEKWRKFYFQPNLFGGNGEFLMRLDTAFEALLTSASLKPKNDIFPKKKTFISWQNPKLCYSFAFLPSYLKKVPLSFVRIVLFRILKIIFTPK